MPIATDKDIAEINELILKALKPGPYVHTTHGPKHLKKITLSEKVSKLLDGNPAQYEKVLQAIREATPLSARADLGAVTVDNETYYWKFRYWDSTDHFHMPNGHRELMIATESEIE